MSAERRRPLPSGNVTVISDAAGSAAPSRSMEARPRQASSLTCAERLVPAALASLSTREAMPSLAPLSRGSLIAGTALRATERVLRPHRRNLGGTRARLPRDLAHGLDHVDLVGRQVRADHDALAGPPLSSGSSSLSMPPPNALCITWARP